MKIAAAIFLGVIAFCGVSCRPAAAPVAVSNKPVSVNDRPTTAASPVATKPLGEMSWTDEKGNVQRISDLGGKAVILDFWATNCPPCVQEIPRLMALQQKYGADKVAIIGLHVGDEEDRANIPKFYREHHLNYPIAFPEDALNQLVFGDGDEIPRTVVLDRNGKVLTRTIGFGDDVERQLSAAVADAVNTN